MHIKYSPVRHTAYKDISPTREDALYLCTSGSVSGR